MSEKLGKDVRKMPEKMTEHELRTEVIVRRAEVNRLRKIIATQMAEPSKAELEEIKDELARDIKGWFMRWRSEYPEENKDIEELPHQNAKNIVSILLKKYNEQRR